MNFFRAALLGSLMVTLGGVCHGQVAPASASGSSSAEETLARAEKLMSEGKPSDAVLVLNELAAKIPEPTGVEAKLGKAYFQSRRFPQATTHLKSALQQNSEDFESMQLLALSYYGTGDYAPAATLLEKLGPRIAKTDADGPYLLAICYIMTQRMDDARKELAQLFSVAPDSAMAYLMLGKILVRQKFEDRAGPEIEHALQLDPKLPMAHFLLGEIALYKENPQAAVAEFQKELAINSTIWLVYWRLGDAFVRLEKFDEAERVLKEAIWLNDSSSGAYILLGEIALKRNDPALAAGFLERALKLDPQNYYVHYFLAKAYQNLGRSAEAAREFEMSKSLRNGKRDDEQTLLETVH